MTTVFNIRENVLLYAASRNILGYCGKSRCRPAAKDQPFGPCVSLALFLSRIASVRFRQISDNFSMVLPREKLAHDGVKAVNLAPEASLFDRDIFIDIRSRY